MPERPPYYPVFLDLRDQRVVVLGGGPVAAGKVPVLLDSGADVVVVAPSVADTVRAAAEASRLRWIERDYRPGDLRGARLAVDATDDPDINRLAREEATRERILLNSVDRTPLCDWIAPALVDRGPLRVAISTAGESPYLASQIRRRLEKDFGAEWGPFVRLVGTLRRRLRAHGIPIAEQERRYRRALRGPARGLLRAGRDAEARAVVDDPGGAGRVVIAGAGPGSAAHLTAAVRDALWDADLVLHDALVDPSVLALLGPRTEVREVGKRGGGASVPQAEIERTLIEEAAAGRDVVRLKGGDPFIFGRGGEELDALRAAGIDVTVLPGLSSATAAPVLAGIPLTRRGVSASVTFCTAHTEHGNADLRALARSADTLVVLMAYARAREVARELAAELGLQRPAALVAGAATPHEAVVRTTLGGLAGGAGLDGLEPPALLIVGEVVATGAAQAGEVLAAVTTRRCR